MATATAAMVKAAATAKRMTAQKITCYGLTVEQKARLHMLAAKAGQSVSEYLTPILARVADR